MMSRLSFLLLLTLLVPRVGVTQTPVTLRSTLLAELHSSHDKADWFVPVNTAVAGLTADRARWTPPNSGKDGTTVNHSVGMLAYHLWFWDARALAKFKGEALPKAPDNNDETFNDFDASSWSKVTRDLDQVMVDLENLVAKASDVQLAQWAPVLTNICTHNAYHTGQILYVRKLQGAWNPANGVK